MAQSLRAIIKAFFQTGDVPTEAQYVDTIDSSVYWLDDVETTLTNSSTKVPRSDAVFAEISKNWNTTLVSASLTASNNTQYIVVASATFTDPSPVEGKGFKVYVRNGTATVGGVAYSVAGSVIWRVYHSGAWANYYSSPTTIDWLTNTVNGTNVTGTTSNTLSASLLIPANTLTTGSLMDLSVRFRKTGTAGNFTANVYINITNAIGGSAIMNIAGIGNTVLWGRVIRTGVVKSATSTEFVPTSWTFSSDIAVSGTAALASLNIDWTVDQYIVVSFQNVSSADTTFCSLISAQIKK